MAFARSPAGDRSITATWPASRPLCRGIAAAKRVDEVKKIRDVSIAMQGYARQAENRELEADAIEIRMRATRRMDQSNHPLRAAGVVLYFSGGAVDDNRGGGSSAARSVIL
jgi:hypothetical protein